MFQKVFTEKIQKKTFSPREAAYAYGICEGTLANWRSKRIGPKFYKAGQRKVFYFESDLENWARREPVQTRDSIEAR